MKKLTKIAIIGYGFVGQAVQFGFNNLQNEILIVDPYKGYGSVDDLNDFHPDFTFVCVPTPMNNTGGIDASTINEVVKRLQNVPCGTVVIKSTVTPDIAKKLCRYKRFVYNPEFLTERNALNDFITPSFHILGGRPEFTKIVKNLYQYQSNCNPAPFHYMTVEEASLVKYGINSFLAMKVMWFNQWKELTENVGARYSIVSNSIGSDPRIGHSHTKVPGPDGKKGFGGSCFPKDTNAILDFAPDILTILNEVVRSNNTARFNYDLDTREIEQKVRFNK